MEKNPQAALFPVGVMLALSKGSTKDIFGATKRVKMVRFWSDSNAREDFKGRFCVRLLRESAIDFGCVAERKRP